MKKYLLLMAAICFGANDTFPDESIKSLGRGWYQATALVEYHEDITKAQEKEKAISRALKNIIETYSGMEISSRSLSGKLLKWEFIL